MQWNKEQLADDYYNKGIEELTVMARITEAVEAYEPLAIAHKHMAKRKMYTKEQLEHENRALEIYDLLVERYPENKQFQDGYNSLIVQIDQLS